MGADARTSTRRAAPYRQPYLNRGIGGLHPNDAGYEAMVPLAERAPAEALK